MEVLCVRALWWLKTLHTCMGPGTHTDGPFPFIVGPFVNCPMDGHLYFSNKSFLFDLIGSHCPSNIISLIPLDILYMCIKSDMSLIYDTVLSCSYRTIPIILIQSMYPSSANHVVIHIQTHKYYYHYHYY